MKNIVINHESTEEVQLVPISKLITGDNLEEEKGSYIDGDGRMNIFLKLNSVSAKSPYCNR